MISKTKAATDLQIKGSMLLKRNKILELLSKSLKELTDFTMTSLKVLSEAYYEKCKLT